MLVPWTMWGSRAVSRHPTKIGATHSCRETGLEGWWHKFLLIKGEHMCMIKTCCILEISGNFYMTGKAVSPYITQGGQRRGEVKPSLFSHSLSLFFKENGGKRGRENWQRIDGMAK